MHLAEDMWLRGQAAQRTFIELTAYNVAFLSTATIQAVDLGLNAPRSFWTAMGRAGGMNAASNPAPIDTAEVVRLHPEPIPVAAAQDTSAPTAASEDLAAGPSPHLLDAPRGGVADDLTELKGIGAKLADALNEFGIYHFDQIATLDADGVDWLNDAQPGFKMTCVRYGLIEQAKAELG